MLRICCGVRSGLDTSAKPQLVRPPGSFGLSTRPPSCCSTRLMARCATGSMVWGSVMVSSVMSVLASRVRLLRHHLSVGKEVVVVPRTCAGLQRRNLGADHQVVRRGDR